MSDDQRSSCARGLAPFSAASAHRSREKIPSRQRLVNVTVIFSEKNGENGRKRSKTA